MIVERESLGCPSCDATASRFDQWCGACGTALAQLRWRGSGSDRWQHGNDRLAVLPDTEVVRVTFGNAGIVPAGLVLRAPTVHALPPWLDCSKLAERPIAATPGANGQFTVEIPVRVVEFRRLFDSLFDRDRDPNLEAVRLEARLTFVTTLGEHRDGTCRARTLEICLLVAKEPWLVPGRSIYRFLPAERLRDEGLEHRVELRNEAAEDIELKAIDVVDDLDARAPGKGRTRILAEQLIAHREQKLPVRVEAGARFEAELRLTLDEAVLPAGKVGWFSAWVEFAFERGGRPSATRALIRGEVGRGPSLELAGTSAGFSADRLLFIQKESLSEPHWITLRNPGDVPVRILRVDHLLREVGEETAPSRDWLALRGVGPDVVLGPGEEREVRLDLRPDRRPLAEYPDDQSYRRIRFLHDGWQQREADRFIEVKLGVQFGKVEEAVAGIDFGTSNSMVCIAGEGHIHPVTLEFGDQQSSTLASLMYYDSGTGGSRDGFLYGDKAYSSARVDPVNLVRSIKTVVSRRPDAHYLFVEPVGGERVPLVRRSARELLNLFIDELRRRGERGVSVLSPAVRDQLKMETAQVVFRRAVFTHPVEVSPEMKHALMEAAHGAGINRHLTHVDEFFEQSCVDEATAAVLAYVDSLVDLEQGSGHETDRLICFDMGGGTTDIAAVEVASLQAYLDDQAPKVQLTLMAKGGDSHFGGDDLDRLLAMRMVGEIERIAAEWGREPNVSEAKHALGADSFSRYVDGFRNRRALLLRVADPDCVDDAQRTYQLAGGVLMQAEEAKRKLSEHEKVHVSLDSSSWFSTGEKPKDRFEFELRREDFDADVREALKPRLDRLDEVVASAGWAWDQVTTLLFSGQSVRAPIVRALVKERANRGRGEDAPPLVFVEPGAHPGFDPKECVAKGAAVWGENWLQAESDWLSIAARMKDHLTNDLQTRKGKRYRTVEGLSAGTPLPARATFERADGSLDRIVLYRGKERHVQFRFPATTKAEVVVDGPGEYWAVVDGQRIRGEVDL